MYTSSIIVHSPHPGKTSPNPSRCELSHLYNDTTLLLSLPTVYRMTTACFVSILFYVYERTTFTMALCWYNGFVATFVKPFENTFGLLPESIYDGLHHASGHFCISSRLKSLLQLLPQNQTDDSSTDQTNNKTIDTWTSTTVQHAAEVKEGSA